MKLARLLPFIAYASLWALVILGGCAAHPPPEPTASSIVLSKSLGVGAAAWEREASKRLERPVVIVCHGSPHDGVWSLVPDSGPPIPVEGAARLLKQLFPTRPLVFVTCNEGNADLTVRGVYYAHGIIWSFPHTPKPGVSTISQFIEGH